METKHVTKSFFSGIFMMVGIMFCGCSQDFIERTESQIQKYREDEISPHSQKAQNSEYWHDSQWQSYPSMGDGGIKKIRIDPRSIPASASINQ